MPQCTDCKFFDANLPADASFWNIEKGEKYGTCRYDPPKTFSDDTYGFRATWPLVETSDWCGKFKGDSSKPKSPKPIHLIMQGLDKYMDQEQKT